MHSCAPKQFFCSKLPSLPLPPHSRYITEASRSRLQAESLFCSGTIQAHLKDRCSKEELAGTTEEFAATGEARSRLSFVVKPPTVKAEIEEKIISR